MAEASGSTALPDSALETSGVAADMANTLSTSRRMRDDLIAARSIGAVPSRVLEYLAKPPLLGSEPASGASGDEEAAPPPSKRRKVSQSKSVKIGLDEDRWADAVPLARFEIQVLFDQKGNLRFSDGLPLRPGAADETVGLDASTGHQHEVHLKGLEGKAMQRHAVEVDIPGLGEEALKFDAPLEKGQIDFLKQCIALQSVRKYSYCKAVFTLSRTTIAEWPACAIRAVVLWRNAQSIFEGRSDKQNDLLYGLTAPAEEPILELWTPRDFYDNVHVPDPADGLADFKVEGLECQLYPFQKRAAQWLLNREGVKLTPDGLEEHDGHAEVPTGFTATCDIDNRPIYLNQWLGVATRDQSLISPPGEKLYGGILAEEMGLGKTVEVLSLVLLHRRKAELGEHDDFGVLRKSNATIIVTPDSILRQWEAEIHMHAPELKVMVYEGVKASTKKASEEEVLNDLLQQDVVLVTYRVLSKEIHYSNAVPERSFRHAKQYERKMSPLVKLHWWRVVLDECQMVESGVSQAARVVNQIPRRNAWAVSGTPLKKDTNDLFGLLTFLRVAPFCWSAQLWARLIEKHRDLAKRLFRTLVLRHSKEQVRRDIQLPPQSRYVINIPFTQIEEQHYATLFQQMCDECGLDLRGAPVAADWDPNDAATVERMRTWLVRLRQVCLHPEVGGRNRRALGADAPLRTVGEVLQVMIDQNDAATRAEERGLHISRLRRGQLLEHAERPKEALTIWKEVYELAHAAVTESRKDYQQAVEDEAANQESENDAADTRLGALRNRLRSALEVEHMCSFFIATAYYQIRSDEASIKPDSAEFKELELKESETYDVAKAIRAEMLRETLSKADGFMDTIKKKGRTQEFVTIPNFKDLDVTGGISSHDTISKIHGLFDALNLQAETLDEWREELVKELTMPLVDRESDELQGDEYETSTKQQEKVYVLMDAVRAMVADRSDAISGLENYLIKEETKTLLKNAEKGEGHAPEMMIEMLTQRLQLKPRKQFRSIRALLGELRAIKTAVKPQADRGNQRATTELRIINSALNRLHQESIRHGKVVVELENEVVLYRDAMNARLDYYRQLQAISDTVAPFEEDLSDARLEQMDRFDTTAAKKVETLRGRGRYLTHLQKNSSAAEVERMCLICQEKNFEMGTLTACGHSFCKDCLSLWWRSHRNCPACKRHLRPDDMHQITYKPSELTATEEGSHGPAQRDSAAQPDGPSSSSRPSSSPSNSGAATPVIYAGLSAATLAQIKEIDLAVSFGSKIDALARHVLWLRAHEPGAKAILFSQFRDFLEALERAFARLGIRCTSIERPGGVARFQHDPAVECFCLHARAHASGLNLVHATHVFLCEPLLHTALELQAVARVHRIGQMRPTSVWLYLVEGTVEKAIYDMSVRRRMTHVPARKAVPSAPPTVAEADIEKANSRELQEAPLARLLARGRTGGETVAKEDLWACLFSAGAARAAGAEPAVGSGDGGVAERAAAAFLAGEAAAERRLA